MVTASEAQAQIERMAQLEGYPKWDDAALAELIQIAGEADNVVALRMVITDCLRKSPQCPRPCDLLSLLKPPATWAQPPSGNCAYGLCDGTGWQLRYALHTRVTREKANGEKYSFVDKSWITEEQYEDLSTKVDWRKQFVYRGALRCKCRPVRVPEVA